jgi:superfamily II DNA/RNA helicase
MAGTGTGKTAAFALPILHRLIENPDSSVLIIAPTRELAQQIEMECRSLGKGSGLMGAILIGGSPMRPQLMDLAARPRIVIGTPGRIKDHLERGSLRLEQFNIVVLDEVDRMLDMGFVRDIRSILDQMHDDRQSLFFSATMNKEVRALIETFSKDPVTIKIQSSVASENVHQDVVHYSGHDDKLNKLKDLLSKDEVSKVIIFDETQRGVERLYKSLYDHGFPVDSMHGGKSQGQRQRALKSFKSNQINFLVATDVAARGIDVADVTHVINYSIPKVYDDYVHRIGRAGRAGKTGYAYTFVETYQSR